ncbi:hypothetical protein J6590_000536 [Homalodisca vitripennis]|nr:hypothetical protein J6590_000536 [Homalodisca vitripennis]
MRETPGEFGSVYVCEYQRNTRHSSVAAPDTDVTPTLDVIPPLLPPPRPLIERDKSSIAPAPCHYQCSLSYLMTLPLSRAFLENDCGKFLLHAKGVHGYTLHLLSILSKPRTGRLKINSSILKGIRRYNEAPKCLAGITDLTNSLPAITSATYSVSATQTVFCNA